MDWKTVRVLHQVLTITSSRSVTMHKNDYSGHISTRVLYVHTYFKMLKWTCQHVLTIGHHHLKAVTPECFNIPSSVKALFKGKNYRNHIQNPDLLSA